MNCLKWFLNMILARRGRVFLGQELRIEESTSHESLTLYENMYNDLGPSVDYRYKREIN